MLAWPSMKLTFSFLLLSLVMACGKKGGSNEAFEKTSAFADQMCACKDADCVKKVTDDMTKWSTEFAKNAKPGDVAAPDPEETKKFEEVTKKMTKCMMDASTPKK